MEGFMIRYHARGNPGNSGWKSVMDGDKVRFFPTSDDAHEYKEAQEIMNGSTFSYNVCEFDASAI